MMPKLDGFGLVHRLRINPETRDIPVIFLTATYVALEDKAFALNIGVTRFIEKPVNFEKFLETVAELFAAGAPPAAPLMSEAEFYEGYRQRLEKKLNQKVCRSREMNACWKRFLRMRNQRFDPPFRWQRMSGMRFSDCWMSSRRGSKVPLGQTNNYTRKRRDAAR
jgi:response regulator RpfG family c-di-GMP phosphodiesterase